MLKVNLAVTNNFSSSLEISATPARYLACELDIPPPPAKAQNPAQAGLVVSLAGPPGLEPGTSRLECDVLPLKLWTQQEAS